MNGLNPGNKAALEALRTQCHKHVTKLIVRWRAVLVRQEAAQKTKLASAKMCNINPSFSTAKDCKQSQQQYLIKWIKYFPDLTRVFKIRKCSRKSISSQHVDIVASIVDRDP